ncbi:MAG: hypothetical protein KKC84_00550 [Candidatus Omnitrophica bacterium]|nr:hypothetical protein [Candidatus Omnitrophota bacterium]
MAITCIVAALIAMQGYLRRSIQGRLRSVADEIGQQYEPRATTGTSSSSYSSFSYFNTSIVTEEDVGKDMNNDNRTKKDTYGTKQESILVSSRSTQNSSEHIGALP